MQIRTVAFLTRSLRQESRLVSHHVMRAALAALVMVLFVLEAAVVTTRTGGGGIFASTVLYCVYWFLTLVGGLYFSTAIVEEKEEETLPLLRMTGASTFSILIGKSLPRLAVALLFLLVIAPFLLLAITLGGVLPYGLVSSILAVLIYSVMLCQLGLFASVVGKDAPRAFSMTVMLWGFLEFSGVWAWLASEMMRALSGLSYFNDVHRYVQQQTWTAENWVTMFCCWSCVKLSLLSDWLSARTLIGNLSDTLMAFNSTEIWRAQMTFHLAVAATFFLLSWLTFDFFTSRAMGEGAAAALATPKKTAGRKSRRVQGPALVWKSWQHHTGGRRWLLFRLIGFPLLVLALVWGISLAVGESPGLEGFGGVYIMAGVILLVITLARLLGNVFNSEIYGKTMNSLLMLPRPRPQVLWPMLVGLAPALLASTSCLVLGLVLLAADSRSFWSDFEDIVSEPWFWQFLVWIVVTAHVGLLLSVYLRYGGMLIAVAMLWFVTPMVFFSTIGVVGMLASMGSWGEDFMQYVVPLFLIPVSLTACYFCQRLILRRVETVGAQS